MVALCALASLAVQAAPWLSEQQLDLRELPQGVVRLRACFDGAAPRRVVVTGPRASKALRGAIGNPSPGCFTARLSADALAERWPLDSGGSGAIWHVDARSLLLQPAKDTPLAGTLEVLLPPGRVLTGPWPALPDGRYALTHDAFSRPGHVFVSGAVQALTPEAAWPGGPRLDWVVLPGFERSVGRDALSAWAARALGVVGALLGPIPSGACGADASDGRGLRTARVVVVPVRAPVLPDAETPVLHGVSSWGGGRHLVIYLRSDVGAAGQPPLVGEWVLIHELFHLAFPWIGPDWLAEGLATYLTEVARVRAGLLTAEGFWEQLVDGFLRGASVGGDLPLGAESEQMGERRTYWRVYWGGAALALLADVALRRQGHTLDEGLRRLLRLCPEDDPLDALDGGARGPFHALAERWLPDKAFPAVDETLTRLGVVVVPDSDRPPSAKGLDGRHVRLDPAPDAALRRRLEAGPSAP